MVKTVGLWALRRWCFKNRYDSFLNITAGALKGPLPEITVWDHSSLNNPQMQVKAVSCKEEAICEQDLETPQYSLFLKRTVQKPAKPGIGLH